jgi:hypothetical protein
VGGVLQQLTLDEFVEAADSWTGHLVVARVVGANDNLISVFCGELGRRSDEKRPALFWPLRFPPESHFEKPGLYLHPDQFEGAGAHVDKTVLELRQAGVTLNIRRL